MSEIKEVVIISCARTAIGGYGGSLKDQVPGDLAACVISEAINRAGVDPASIGACVLGHVIHTQAKDMYMSRYASIKAGLPESSQALTLNRLCGSGLQAIISAAQQIMLGDVNTAVAGGVEIMSRGGYLLPKGRWGQYMGDGQVIDMMVGALTDPFDVVHMGITAENIASQWNISREAQDKLAVESHHRAAKATKAGYFIGQIMPIELTSRKGPVVFDTDEHIRENASMQGMAKLHAVFKADGSVTAGNASGINDAAAAVVLMEQSAAQAQGLKVMGKLIGYSLAGVDPKVMGIGPVPAINNLLEKTGIGLNDIDLFELNEAFAAQALACVKDLKLDPAKVNPNGSGIGLGHPIGATGTILTVKLLHELKRTGGRYGVVSMCIGGGQGIAALFENME